MNPIICRLEKRKIKERLEQSDISRAMNKSENSSINYNYFWQMLISPENLTPVYAPCHDREKKCRCECQCNCPSIDENKVFMNTDQD